MAKTQKEHWEIYQPNPTEPKFKSTKGDCAIRCISAALNVDWRTAFDILAQAARDIYSSMGWPDSIDKVLTERGFEKHAVKREKGSVAPTPNKMAEMYPDKVIVCRVSNHFVCVRDGKYWDTWQSGNKTIYTYWMK